MNDIRLCAVVVTYHPNVTEVIENINRYIDDIDHLIIWRNTPYGSQSSDIQVDNQALEPYKDKVSFMGTGVNEGIAYPLNQAAKWAVVYGYTHLLTMDQDSYWEDFPVFKAQFIHAATKYKIIAPNVNWVWPKQDVKEANICITSGATYDLKLFEEVGYFCEDYFIDAIDTEMCYRALEHGYPTAILGHCNLKQHFGNTEKKKYCSTSHYSPFRRYHIMRNHIWLWRNHSQIMDIAQKKRTAMMFPRETYKILAFEKFKFQKLRMLCKGVYDGLFRNPGGRQRI